MTAPGAHPRSAVASRVFVALAVVALATTAAPAAAVVTDEPREATSSGRWVVLFDDPPLAAYGGGIDELAPTNPEVTGAARLDVDSAASQAYLEYLATRRAEIVAAMAAALGRKLEVVHVYDAVLNGVAVELSGTEPDVVAGVPGVARVEADQVRFLQTDNGPEWIGAPSVWDGAATGGLPGTRAEGIVVGVLDTGVNHDHPSFADVGGDGFNHTNPRGRFFGLCDPVTGAPFCNDKLIGVHDFTGSTPEDLNGHGSHTASTSAGNVLDAEMVAPTITLARAISGVAPHANLITYKVCPAINCLLTAILAGINQAALDEVDVINYSIGGASTNPWDDLDARAFLDARRAGVFVSASAGNSGPGAATIGSPADAPWILAVGASTHDRKFINSLVDMTGGATAAPADMQGKSITAGYGPAPIVYAGDVGDPLCQTPFPPGTWTNGEIVICDRGVNPRVAKAENVAAGGAEGFVLANDEPSGDSIIADAYVIPGVHITFNDGVTLKAWVDDGGGGHTATITGTVFDENAAHGDVMASFSSRGPNPSVPDVLKPDVTAPGVDIFAAWMTTNPLAAPEYNVISGTSMSSPHAAGSAALLRGLYPDWSPDEVRSALMTTGFTILPGTGREAHDVLKEDAATPADPFDYGNGRVDLTQAGQVGLVLDETAADYEAANPALGGDPQDLNLASLSDSACPGVCSWERTVTSTSDAAVTWTTSIAAPAGMSVSVEPSSFTLEPGASQTISVSADVRGVAVDAWHFARIFLVPDAEGTPDAELQVAAFARPGEGEVQQSVLHFHGSPGAHDSGEPDEANCTGNGTVDVLLEICGGPYLLESGELSPEPAASFGPTTVLLDCTVDRCPVDPNWVWNLPGPTTLSGPMAVEWWYGCPGCELAFFEDFFIRLWADEVLVLEQRVRHTQLLPGVPVRLADTITVPEVTANETFVLHIDPIFVNQEDSIVWYDSTQACPGGTTAPCDSLVRMPVVAETALPDLQVTALEASRQSPRASDPVTVTATVSNLGEGDAAASTTELVLDDATPLGTVETPALSAGGSTTVSVEWNARGLNGEHVIRATADSALAVVETDEANNSGTLTVTVRGNRVENGSFEQPSTEGSSPQSWEESDTGAGEASWSVGGAHGAHSVTFTATGGNAAVEGSPTWTSAPVAVTAGETLVLTASVSADGSSSAGSIGLIYLDAAGGLLDTVRLLTTPIATDGFKPLETTVTIPAGVAEVRVVLNGFAPTDLRTAGSVTFDEIGLYAE
jgi:hypothetical protein